MAQEAGLWTKSCTFGSNGSPGPGPWGQGAAEQDEQRVRDEGQRDGKRAGSDVARLEAGSQPVEDRCAQPLRNEERADGRERDRGHGRDADPRQHGRQRQRQLHAHERLRARQTHPARRLEHVRGHAAQAAEDVPEQDQERVADQRDLDRRHRQPGEGHEQLEEREARDRVEQGEAERERRLEPPDPVHDERCGERDREPETDGDQRQLHVLDEPRLQRVVPVLPCPVPAEGPVLAHALRALPEVRDDRPVLRQPRDAGGHSRSGRAPSRRDTWASEIDPTMRPSSFTDARARPSESMIESASRSVVSGSSSGSPGSWRSGPSRSTSPSRTSESRFRPRSAPTKRATKSSAGCARSSSGDAYCASRPPSRSTATRSPILIASSMSCVTKMTVFGTRSCRAKNSSWSRSRVIGSSAPNGSSMSITAGSAARARASPTRWRWPPESWAGKRRRSASGSRPTSSSSSPTRSRIRARGQPSSRGTVAMLSSTDRCGKSPTCWITYPIRRRSAVASSCRTLVPSM